MSAMRWRPIGWVLLLFALQACSTNNEKPYVPQGPVIATSSARSQLAPSGATLGGVEPVTQTDCVDPDDPECVANDSSF